MNCVLGLIGLLFQKLFFIWQFWIDANKRIKLIFFSSRMSFMFVVFMQSIQKMIILCRVPFLVFNRYF
jgi:hypothetical protein